MIENDSNSKVVFQSVAVVNWFMENPIWGRVFQEEQFYLVKYAHILWI